MKKISQILIESQDKRKQTTGRLVRSHNDDMSDKPETYCALGAIACELGMITRVGDENGMIYASILEKAGLPKSVILKEYFCTEGHEVPYKYAKLTELIVHFNDYHKLPFKKIGEKLQKDYGL